MFNWPAVGIFSSPINLTPEILWGEPPCALEFCREKLYEGHVLFFVSHRC